jgi:dCTP deaminase
MLLSNTDIKEYLKKGKIKIKPLKPEQIGPASVDLTLGNRFWFFKKKYVGKRVDLKKIGFKEATKEVRADTCVLGSGEMCLGITKEKITLPPDVMGRLEGRSRYARMGLGVHITSAVVQPGSDNHQVLEIVNNSPFESVFHAGMRISQIVFYRMRSPSTKPYAKYGKIARKQ